MDNKKANQASSLLFEETRATKWFLIIFYITYFIYDVTTNYIIPRTLWAADISSPGNGLSLFIYIIMLGLLPVAIKLIKKQKPEPIKYIYFITFTFLNTINDIWIYWGSGVTYANGNIVEIVIVLFAPLFINRKFFALVFIGTVAKFVIVGIALQDAIVLVPLLIVVVISFISFILLSRFLSYVETVKDSYNKQLEGIVKGIISTLELKDHYTRGHSERVANYALILAKATGQFKKRQLDHFYYTCLLHDIGKVNIPDSILSKPSKLTEAELEIVKQHPTVGAEAIKNVEVFSEYMDVITYHHERWDGQGYPEGLQKDKIPLVARITAIADAFDAMTTSRSYRAALSVEEAFQRIVGGKGTQFDPKLVDTFIDTFPIWKDFHDKSHG